MRIAREAGAPTSKRKEEENEISFSSSDKVTPTRILQFANRAVCLRRRRFFNRSLRQLFPRTILQRHDFATVPVDGSPHAAFDKPVFAIAFLRAAAAYHGPALLEGKPPVIARRYHHPQLAVDIADLAIDLRSCPPLDE